MTLRELRKKRNFTYRDLIRNNIYPPAYYLYETGENRLENMKLETAVNYCRMFGFSDPEELLELDQPDPKS